MNEPKYDIIMVKACPRCGLMALSNCWHPETDDIATEEMPISQAAALLDETITTHIERTNDLLLHMRLMLDLYRKALTQGE